MNELREYLEKLGEALYLHAAKLKSAEEAEESVQYLHENGVLND